MSEHTGRTTICSIVFLDIVRYSEAPDAAQFAMKDCLNQAIAQAVAGISGQDRVILDTGDGAAICFLGDPEDALFAATAINDAVRKEQGDGAQALRTGINLGPVKLVTDLNGRTNVIGDGINVAQRIMSFAEVGEILVSRSYYEVVARLREGNERLFHYMGSKRDKHVREHQLYAFGLHSTSTHPCQPTSAAEQELAPAEVEAELVEARLGARVGALSAELVAVEEARLTAYIGPLAKVIAKRAAESASSVDAFYETIAAVIQDPADRASFLAAAPASEAAGADVAPRPTERSSPASGPPALLGEAELQRAERELAKRIGPLASVLVKKAARQATDRRDLYLRLGASIANGADRAAFLATAGIVD